MDEISVAIIINSCEKFYEKTIPNILKSAKIAKIPFQNIYVVVGECEFENIKKEKYENNEYNIIFCKYVNIDYNGAIFISKNEKGLEEIQKYTHFFYIHDTSEFLDCFWEKINNYSKNCDSYIKIEKKHSKNIGLFNTKWFLNNKKELLSYYINYDKNLALKYKDGDYINKDFIYKNFKNLPHNINEDSLFDFVNQKPIGKVFINKLEQKIENKFSNEDRLATFYYEPGIIKYQKNFGKNNTWNINL